MINPPFSFVRIDYGSLNARQKENYNFHQLAARLADHGFDSLRLSDDRQGADLIARHIDGQTVMRVQLKGRLAVNKRYRGKDLHIGFLSGTDCFVYPHDAFLEHLIARGSMNEDRENWRVKGIRSWPRIPAWANLWLSDYRL